MTAESDELDNPRASIATLAKATGIALATAAGLLVLVVLPAEYNIDPTGFGAETGLTRLSAPGGEAAATPASTGLAPDARSDRVVIEVPALRGIEYKFSLRAGDKMEYSWEAESGSLHFDFHGEPEGDETGAFESYVVGTASKTHGTFTAPFDGIHGWYWKPNDLSHAKVTLTTSGFYQVVGLK